VIPLRGKMQVMGKRSEKGFGNVLLRGRKTGFLLEVVQENGESKPPRASVVGEEVHVLGESDKMLDQFFHVPSAFHRGACLQFWQSWGRSLLAPLS
jgi:hypothetical protein